MDTGGLAQMTYNHNNGLGAGLGFPHSGYGSRGKGDNIKKLNVPPPYATENQPAPRTSRSHLLAGLRTAPKSPGFPTSAPPTQMEQPVHNGSHLSPAPRNFPQAPPKTATGMGFGNNNYQNQHQQQNQHQHQQQNPNRFRQVYSPDQILAPPAIHIGEDGDDGQMDPRLYEELMRTNQYLAQQQMRLQQQLINVTAAAQQFQGMNLGQGQGQGQSQSQSSGQGQEGYTSSPMSFYNQQLQQGVQPVVQPVAGSPGLFTVFNPMTGQTTLAYDQNASQQGPNDNGQGPTPPNNTLRARVSPPPKSPSPVNRSNWRSGSPPKISTSPPRDDTTPLPPPSANAFRSHRKNNLSLINGSTPIPDGPKTTTSVLKSTFPRTPMTGGFGPGQAQEGEHPARQPRGPPSMEDLVAKPTTKFEGSRNFASRQRRGAVKNLVRAGIERRGVRSSAHSSDSGSPTSEAPMSVASADDLSVRSGSASLEGRRYFDKPRSPNPGVIGGERKELKERSRERQAIEYTASSVSSDDDLVEVKPEGRRSNLPLHASAEKQRGQVY